MPVEDCLPFYLAQCTGIYERIGLDLRIHTYQAQLDTDTALANGHVHVAYSDIIRTIMLQQDTTDVRLLAATGSHLQLITTRRGRIRNLSQLKEKMVAVARHSITDYWSDRLTDSAAMARADIFRPQINSLRIRTDMLCNGTMDAAFLPEPFASEARLRGGRANFTTERLSPSLCAIVATYETLRDTTRRHQIQLLLQGYNEVVNSYSKTTAPPDSLRPLISRLCLTPDTLLDTLISQLPHFTALAAPEQADIDAAMQWLRSRNKIKQGYTADSLLTPQSFKLQ